MNEPPRQLKMDHVQYDGTPPGSIFGPGECIVLQFFERVKPRGSWINLGAGDGRYSGQFLETCDALVAFDNDGRALAKLERDLPPEVRSRLKLAEGDLTKTLGFPNGSFDGVFCSATIHIFDEDTISNIVSEMFRIVRRGGLVVTDFLCDIERVMEDGSLYLYPGEISYCLADAQRVIQRSFAGRNYKIGSAEVADEDETNNGVARYFFKSKILLIEAVG